MTLDQDAETVPEVAGQDDPGAFPHEVDRLRARITELEAEVGRLTGAMFEAGEFTRDEPVEIRVSTEVPQGVGVDPEPLRARITELEEGLRRMVERYGKTDDNPAMRSARALLGDADPLPGRNGQDVDMNR